MNYIQEIIRELLLEEVEQNKITFAIKKRHEVSFIYDSGDGDRRGKGERITVQPVAYGTTKVGNPCFRAYQLNGSSESAEKNKGSLPGWRLFLLDKVKHGSWKDTGRIFNEPPLYNPNGDNTMAEVFVQADFVGTQTRYERGGLKKYNDDRHAKNVEKNPYYDFQKQVNKKQMAPSFVMKNIKDTEKNKEEREKEWIVNKNALKGNQQSISDMAKQKDFGNDKQSETIGPLRKGDTEETIQMNNKPNNYDNALQNGPKFKDTTAKINNDN